MNKIKGSVKAAIYVALIPSLGDETYRHDLRYGWRHQEEGISTFGWWLINGNRWKYLGPNARGIIEKLNKKAGKK
jgi:hypothetical protein